MPPRFPTICLLIAIVLSPRGAAGDTTLRCTAAQCDFVVSGGGRDHNLLLQPNDGDPRSGRLKLNGFAEIFPDWQPPNPSGMDRLFTWSPTADLLNGSSVRLFDIAPHLTVADATGSTIFSVTGSLTRTGSFNSLYQWTGFYTRHAFPIGRTSDLHRRTERAGVVHERCGMPAEQVRRRQPALPGRLLRRLDRRSGARTRDPAHVDSDQLSLEGVAAGVTLLRRRKQRRRRIVRPTRNAPAAGPVRRATSIRTSSSPSTRSPRSRSSTARR